MLVLDNCNLSTESPMRCIHIVMLACRGSLDVATGLLQPVPILGMLAKRTEEIICGTQKYYTYTSAN